MATRYGKQASAKVERVMKEKNAGTLKSGSGAKVTSRKQAIAIGLSEARKEGAKVPPAPGKKAAKATKKSATKKSATKKSAPKKAASKKTATKAATKKAAKKKTAARKKAPAKKSS